MNYQTFIQHLPKLYENWGKSSVRPHSQQFELVLQQVQGMTTANVMQLLNLAVECMGLDEVYCEIGCFQGATLIGALLNHPTKIGYAVDNFSEFDDGQNFELFSRNLSLFNLEEQVIFCNQSFEEFFFDLRTLNPDQKIGVYFYNGANDYRSQLLELLLVKPFLAEQALIIINNTNSSSVQQANWDFMAAHCEFQLLLDFPTPQDHHHTFWNGLQVFSWDINQESVYEWSNFSKTFRNQPLINAVEDFNLAFEFEIKKQKLQSLTKEALTLEFSNQFAAAEQKYQEVLQWDRNNASGYHNLGMFYYSRQQYQDALPILVKSLELAPDNDTSYYSLGLVLEKLNLDSQAIAAYEQAIALNPQLVDAYNNLGNILTKLGKLAEAEVIYRQATTANPNHFGGYLNLGNLLVLQKRIAQAIDAYQKALELKPRDPDIIFNLAMAFSANGDQAKYHLYYGYAAYRQNKYEEAINYFHKYLEQEKGEGKLYLDLSKCYIQLNQTEVAIKIYKQGIKAYPNELAIYLMLMLALQQTNRIQEAISTANQAEDIFPNNSILQFEKQRLFPIIYEDFNDIEVYRERFFQGLDLWIKNTSLDLPESKDNALKSIAFQTNVLLQYQSKNDLQLHMKYGGIVHQVMADTYPQWVQPRKMPNIDKIRIGYISGQMYNTVVGKLTLGWLQKHNREQFEIYSYYIYPLKDSKTQQFQVYSDVFHHIPEDLEAVCHQIIDDQLHILCFLELGMNPLLTQIASLRLAPLQCTAWGNPTTSGLPTIDYFLSSDQIEPENAQEHYSEKLIRLPNLGFPYPKPVLPAVSKKRSEFQLRDDAVVYLCSQSFQKYLPQYDYIFPAIAQRVSEAQLIFIAGNISKSITEKFQLRLQKAFASFGMNSEEYCIVLPNVLSYDDFLNLNLVSDIFLDTFGWSGAITTLDAIACSLPVVTCPGELMRGRQSFGMLKMIGVTETIAQNEEGYIEIAVKLGLDQEWRASIANKIKQNQDRVYEDSTCVEALEEFYQRLVQEHQNKE
ncbi:MAG: tetratricopeptide repeat protein [Crinalium sp.]